MDELEIMLNGAGCQMPWAQLSQAVRTILSKMKRDGTAKKRDLDSS